MKIYLAAGESYYRNHTLELTKKLQADGLKVNVLYSFLSFITRGGIRATESFSNIFDSFMLDSGAFSLLRQGEQKSDLDSYVSKYIDFINKNKIELFFELDLYSIIGYEDTIKIRRRLEKETGKQPIPVWHRHLGSKEFLKMCDEYKYVSIGGIAAKDIKPSEYDLLKHFIFEAHKRGRKIHGLGFTHNAFLPKLHFDSVDSSSWTYGTRGGNIYLFDKTTRTIKYAKKPKGRRVMDRLMALHNFTEWVKYSNWAETNL